MKIIYLLILKRALTGYRDWQFSDFVSNSSFKGFKISFNGSN